MKRSVFDQEIRADAIGKKTSFRVLIRIEKDAKKGRTAGVFKLIVRIGGITGRGDGGDACSRLISGKKRHPDKNESPTFFKI
jgi:hypothetical protein